MIATSIHESIQVGAETFFKMEKGASAHRISAWWNVDEICQKKKIIKNNFSANP